MRPVEETPTARSDYALLSVTYLSLAAALAESARRRGTAGIPSREIVPLSLATFALSKMVVNEKVESWLRAPFVEEPAGGERRPKGRRMRYAIGELLTCTRCTGAWSAVALVGLRTHAPTSGRVVTTLLATSAGNDFLHSAFTLLCETANASRAAATADPDPAARR